MARVVSVLGRITLLVRNESWINGRPAGAVRRCGPPGRRQRRVALRVGRAALPGAAAAAAARLQRLARPGRPAPPAARR